MPRERTRTRAPAQTDTQAGTVPEAFFRQMHKEIDALGRQQGSWDRTAAYLLWLARGKPDA